MAGGNDRLRDSMSANNTVGHRLTVHKDQKAGITEVPYSSGHTVMWERTEVGDGKRLKEVRTITRIDSPKTRATVGDWPTGSYERIFGHTLPTFQNKEED